MTIHLIRERFDDISNCLNLFPSKKKKKREREIPSLLRVNSKVRNLVHAGPCRINTDACGVLLERKISNWLRDVLSSRRHGTVFKKGLCHGGFCHFTSINQSINQSIVHSVSQLVSQSVTAVHHSHLTCCYHLNIFTKLTYSILQESVEKIQR